jgi:hypothetical protein
MVLALVRRAALKALPEELPNERKMLARDLT